MKMRLSFVAVAATAVAWLTPPPQAGCVIALESDEKNFTVSCKVDTKIGVVQVSCAGNTPPLAKTYSLCEYNKAGPW